MPGIKPAEDFDDETLEAIGTGDHQNDDGDPKRARAPNRRHNGVERIPKRNGKREAGRDQNDQDVDDVLDVLIFLFFRRFRRLGIIHSKSCDMAILAYVTRERKSLSKTLAKVN